MAAPSLMFGAGDWELAGWYQPQATPSPYAGLFVSNGPQWASGAATLQQGGTGGAYPGRLGLASYGGTEILSGILAMGQWYYLRAQRVAGTLRLFVNEVLAGSLDDARPWNLSLVGVRNWAPLGALAGVLAHWSAATSGISTTPGSIPDAPAPVAQWYPNNFQAGLLDAVFGGGQVLFTADSRAFADNPDFARTHPVRYSAISVIRSDPVPPFSTPRPSAAQMARDAEFGGSGTLSGTTTLAGQPDVPTKARVSILRLRDKKLARQVWSDPATGKWRVDGLDTDRTRYVALAEYPGNPDDPNADGYLRPVAGVSPLAPVTGGRRPA